MNDEEIKKLQELKADLLQITTSEDALADLPADQRAAMLIFKINSSDTPSMGMFEQAKKAIDEIEDASTKTDAALDLMGAIDLATGEIVEDDAISELQTPTDGQDEAPTSDDGEAEKAQDHDHQ